MKRPRFSLRDLFWLVLVAAMGCAWWVKHREAAIAWEQAVSLDREKDQMYLKRSRDLHRLQYVAACWARDVNREITIRFGDDVLHATPAGGIRHSDNTGETERATDIHFDD